MRDFGEWIDPGTHRLGPGAPVPLASPFTLEELHQRGVARRTAEELLRQGLIRPMCRGVYAASQAPDTVQLRARALALVVPSTAVITDRTAAWLHGVSIQRRSERARPALEMFERREGARTRRPEVRSGERRLAGRDVMEVEGLLVTTPLRTACDLGRLLWRFDALGALDALCRQGLDPGRIAFEANRFRGYRGVRQLRTLVPLIEPLSESMGESALRLHWIEAGLPHPDVQIWVYDDNDTGRFRIDMGIEELRFGAEYDGEEHHSSPDDVARDRRRRRWLRDERGWTIEVFTKDEVYRPNGDVGSRLMTALVASRLRPGSWWSRGA